MNTTTDLERENHANLTGERVGSSESIERITRAGEPTWLDRSQIPWLKGDAPLGPEFQAAFRLLDFSVNCTAPVELLREVLPDLASELAAPWVAVVRRGTDWECLHEFGRRPLPQWPAWLLHESLERRAAGTCVMQVSGSDWTVLVAPLTFHASGQDLLVGAMRSEPANSDAERWFLSIALGYALEFSRQQAVNKTRIDRLHGTLQVAGQLASIREMQPLLERIAQEAARLLETDRASIFVWDRPHNELMACPALGVPGGILRIPDDQGIVGECVQNGTIVQVDDAYQDQRFNRDVDLKTGYRTRNLLCVPLITPDGKRVGAFEVLNKIRGDFHSIDAETLIELGRQAVVALDNTREREQLIRRQRQLSDQVRQHVTIIGESPQIRALKTTIDRLAQTDLPVLVLGESGVGKEVVAQSLHELGARREQPFIAVNCAAMTESLLESELFGHERGAFTDAREMRQGKFELAEGGTLFLDEIGDMSLGGQAKLLRALEQRTITRVGGSQSIRINVRIVAATNINLTQAVRERRFREDLYYRLGVVTVEIQPLRERSEDILHLANYFLERFASQAGRKTLHLSPEAAARLQSHAWPGNVRELRNLMERITFLCTSETIGVEDLAFMISPGRDSSIDATELGLSDATAQFQIGYIRRMIKRENGNMTEVARHLGMHRSNLYRKMRQLGMDEHSLIPEGE